MWLSLLNLILHKIDNDKKNIKYEVTNIYNEKIILGNKELAMIAKIINDNIFNKYPSLKLLYNYFIDMGKLLSKLNIMNF